MSRGPGVIEKRVADLFAATRDRALGIDEIAAHAFGLNGARPSRAQRLSATRAAHRVVRRVRDMRARADELVGEGHEASKAALGRQQYKDKIDQEYEAQLNADPFFARGIELHDAARRIGVWTRFMRDERPGWIKSEDDFWCATTVNGRLWFHPPDAPVRVWAVSIQRAGVIWAEAEVTKITPRNVMVRYADDLARLDREALWNWWAFWRGVRFVSSRTGRIADKLDAIWQEKYGRAAGGVPAAMQMPIAQAFALLGVPANYTRDDVIAGFRRAVKKAHPDVGGTPEMFRLLVEARDRLLAALGTSAPAPKMPTYAPKGARVVYRRVSSRQARIGSTIRQLR
jgi:hypothetical protein